MLKNKSTPDKNHQRSPVERAGMRVHTNLRISFVALAFLAALTSGNSITADELLVFTQKTDSAVSTAFQDLHLPELVREAATLKLEIQTVDVSSNGAPAEVRLTPLIVYQSARGRAVFQGRYVDAGKIKHFIRTQRAIAPTDGTLEVTDAAIATIGRAQVLAPIKITPLSGHPPLDHDAAAFDSAARAAIHNSFRQFKNRSVATLGSSDRSFYMDFHPFRSEDGRIFISTSLFSQFNCIEPVFTRFEEPTGGDWSRWQDAFAQAARELEDQVFAQIAHSKIGDGFDGVPLADVAPSWHELGLDLPPAAKGTTTASADVELPTHWRLTASADSGPQLLFRFPPPLERYSGEVSEIAGELRLKATDQLDGAVGFITVQTSSVTMGEKALDDAVRGKMLFADRFPQARFELETASSDAPLAFGRISRMVAKGQFTMMGFEVPLDVRAQLEPIIGEDGKPRLHVQAGFDLRLKAPFGIEGPHGPTPANDTLNFHLNVLLDPGVPAAAPGP